MDRGLGRVPLRCEQSRFHALRPQHVELILILVHGALERPEQHWKPLCKATHDVPALEIGEVIHHAYYRAQFEGPAAPPTACALSLAHQLRCHRKATLIRVVGGQKQSEPGGLVGHAMAIGRLNSLEVAGHHRVDIAGSSLVETDLRQVLANHHRLTQPPRPLKR
jgi:hypothetical protein